MQSSEMHAVRSTRGAAPTQKIKLNRRIETNREINVDDVTHKILLQDVQHLVKYVTTAIKRTIMHEIVPIKQSGAKSIQWMRVTLRKFMWMYSQGRMEIKRTGC